MRRLFRPLLLLLLSLPAVLPVAVSREIGVAELRVTLPKKAAPGTCVYSKPFRYNDALYRLQLFPRGRGGYATRHGYYSLYLERVGDERVRGRRARCKLYEVTMASSRSPSPGISFDLAVQQPSQTPAPHFFCSAHEFAAEPGAESEAVRKGAVVFGRQEALQGRRNVVLRARLGPPGLRLESYDLAEHGEDDGGPGALLGLVLSPVGGLLQTIRKSLGGEPPAPRPEEPTGLENLCNTCYMNSVLQALYAVRPFKQGLLNPEFDGPGIRLSQAFEALRDTFHDMAGEAATPQRRRGPWQAASVSPASLAKRLGIDTRVQQDAQEFTRLLVESLGKGSDVDLAELFSGKVRTTIVAPEADFEKTRDEAFQDLSLDVAGLASLDQALKRYTGVDVLDGDNKYRVKDKGYFRAERFTRFLGPLPPVLQIHLKRFAFDPETFQMRKVNSRLSFPEDLDMRPYLAKGATAHGKVETKYELQSVVIHVGGVDSGHYYAFVRAPGERNSMDALDARADWFRVDDTDVRPVNEGEMQKEAFGGSRGDGRFKWMTPTAYLLQYVRKDL